MGDLAVNLVDCALDRLRRPTTVEDRFAILQQLVRFWHGPIRPEDGMSDAELVGVPLPMPLRRWYRWAGKRPNIISGQNRLFVPRDPQRKHGQLSVNIDDGRLNFYAENQGVYQWSTLQSGDDPPVFGRYEVTEPWAEEKVTLSEHLILMCLFEGIMCHSTFEASAAWLDEERLAAIVRTIPPVAIGPWRWIGLRFFARHGAFMCVAEHGDIRGKKAEDGKRWYSVSIGARTAHPLTFLKPFLDETWDYVALGEPEASRAAAAPTSSP